MRLGWAIVGGLLLGGAAWWLAREPEPAAAAGHQATAATGDARHPAHPAAPGLYRWRDEQGRLHVTDTPPTDRPYEEIPRNSDRRIDVHGDR